MNERHLINNVLIKYFVARRYSKCMYKKRDDADGGLLRLYKYAKWYKELKTVESYGELSERLYVTYTSDRHVKVPRVKVPHVKQRVIKQKVMKNFQMVFSVCFFLLVILSCIACLLIYNNNQHVECVLPYGECPVILHKDIENFFVNARMHELSKERILEVYSVMKTEQRKGSSKSDGKGSSKLDGKGSSKLDGKGSSKLDGKGSSKLDGKGNVSLGRTDGMILKKKKKYSLLNSDNVKCSECHVVFHLEGKETLEDIFHFEEINKCEKTIGREHCVNVKDGVMWNRRIHLYKRYSGPIKNADTLEKGAAREKVVLDDKVKFLHPFLKDYVLNLDYFTLRSETGQKIPVNEEPLRGGETLKEKNRHICRPDYRETFGKNTFYWLCPQFYEEDRESLEYRIALSIMQMVNMEGAGEADANKHILEMTKSSATARRYDHFGFIEDKLELPLKVEIFSRFQPQGGETERVEMLERIYKAFFCRGRGGSSSSSEGQHRQEKEKQEEKQKEKHKQKHHGYSHSAASHSTAPHSAASHQDDVSRMAFFFPEHGGGGKEVQETVQGEVGRDTYNDLGKENTSVHIESSLMSDEEEYLSLEDLCREDHCAEMESTSDAKETSVEEGEGHSRRVLIKEMPTFRKDKRKEQDPKGLNKELVIISPSLFFGIMDGMLSIVIFFLLLLLGMICVLVAIYICLTIGYDMSVILRGQDDIEEMPRYLNRLSRQLTGGGGRFSVGGTDGDYFRIHRLASDPF
ncbi:hypothetical protein PCYB_074060 [Plasmodium cynomolgi strain B]|uniref:Uncharacterized protein n=1 Tax=Plasmodium cynomolgi (strain B) TaxID=1120755 RepID=K6URW7_PLACD|nr:hypothetical protein PCYB_074060 [Plasmodium cynomolgi strain B]GAB65904.1 hypothetical protein PCYB_074060 [Plasmodium cynomolgi strain B]